ncbi:MAG: glycoside hydrolase family 18 protein [Legionellales bacterium]|nr:glycoside hydrolase family 18 protein [Legionellales bacterium]
MMKPIIATVNIVTFCSVAFVGSACAVPLKKTNADDVTNFYISYYSPADVATQISYQAKNGVNSTIIWEMSGDINPVTDPKNSLINAIYQANPNAYSIAYWADWNIYSANHALPYNAYFVPGAVDVNGTKINNQNFDDQAKFLSAIVYSFLEIAPDGTLYFNDPWSDLLATDSWCQNGMNKTCSYAYTSQGKTYAAQYGNFEALANYSNGKSIDKYISVGGYGHDASFEQILGDADKVNTFADTTLALLNQYHLTGVDLDYENPNMTALQSQQFADLIQTLNTKLNGQYSIMVTSLADPAYLKGEKAGGYGFAPGVLETVAKLSQVKRINLMTYDFYGAFNYNPDGSGRTGFLSDTYMPNNAPQGSVNFSVEDSIETLMGLGVPAAKMSGGIPTYGRALQGISSTDGLNNPATNAYSGLYASILSSSIIPRGDLDDIACVQSIYPLTVHSCSGSFTYSYILQNFINSNFTTVDWKNDASDSFNGTTAYTSQYAPPVSKNYNLEVQNLSNDAGGQVLSITNGTVNVGQLDWMNPNADFIYNNTTNPNVLAIQGASNLIVTWNSPYAGKQYQCSAFNFTSNTHVMINPQTGACDIKAM